MEHKQKVSTRKIVFVALMAALTVAGSALRITLPIDIAGTTSFHLGNIMCALSGLLLGPWLGGLASGLGSAIYDMTNPLYISECWITFLTKGAYGLVPGLVLGKKDWNYWKAAIATAAGALTYAVLYRADPCRCPDHHHRQAARHHLQRGHRHRHRSVPGREHPRRAGAQSFDIGIRKKGLPGGRPFSYFMNVF